MTDKTFPAFLTVCVMADGTTWTAGHSSIEKGKDKPDWEGMEELLVEQAKSFPEKGDFVLHRLQLRDLPAPSPRQAGSVSYNKLHEHSEELRRQLRLRDAQVSLLTEMLVSAGMHRDLVTRCLHEQSPLSKRDTDGYVMLWHEEAPTQWWFEDLGDALVECRSACMMWIQGFWKHKDPDKVDYIEMAESCDVRLYRIGKTCEQVPFPLEQWFREYKTEREDSEKESKREDEDKLVLLAVGLNVVAKHSRFEIGTEGKRVKVYQAAWDIQDPLLEGFDSMVIRPGELDAFTPRLALVKWGRLYQKWKKEQPS